MSEYPLVVREKPAHLAIFSCLSCSARRVKPFAMRLGQHISHDRTGNYVNQWLNFKIRLEIDKAIEESRSSKAFVLLAHMPSTIRPLAASSFNLDGAEPRTFSIGHDNISIRDSGRC